MLENMGFTRKPIYPCVYEIKMERGKAILAVYVDDMFVLAENQEVRNHVKSILENCFDIKYLGEVSQMLSVKFTENEDRSVTLLQEDYVDRLLKKFGMQDAKGIQTPMEEKPVFLDEDSEGNIHEFS